MSVGMKQRVTHAPVFRPVRNWIKKQRQIREVHQWEANGRPAPPPHIVKQRAIREHAHRYGTTILVETGTYRGDMVEAMKHDFDRIYSIELSEQLHEECCERFARTPHVTLLQGDSGRVLGELMPSIDQPTLFWLDGHYSAGVTAQGEKDTPIWEELGHIFAAPDLGHVLLIDDARCFGQDDGYPTITELQEFVRSHRPHLQMTVQDDSIRFVPT
ncbi:MAG: hypothetical protein R3B91_06250 [Planctomycetaceae bacterium]